MRDRIKKIIESQHMTQQEFAECIKVAPATLSSIFTGRTAPSLKIVEAIKNRFPDISTDWLMFGRGAMTDYKSEEAGTAFGHPSPTEQSPMLDFGASASMPTAAGGAVGAAATDGYGTAMTSGSGDAAASANPSAARQNARGGQQVGGVQLVNNCDKHERRIVEIRIFYDDQTWETFVPKK